MAIRCGNCKDSHQSAQGVKVCYADAAADAAEAAAEAYAEAISSWCAGGGNYHDAQVYARVIASGQTWEDYLHQQDVEFAKIAAEMGDCEHGLSAALCAGPGHYPADSYFD